MKIVNKTYNIDNKINTNIVLISDIHYHSKTDLKLLDKVLEEIKKIKPNYICITGDIIDEAYITDEKDFINWLTKLSKITKVIIALGNHEYYINKFENIYGLNKELIDKISSINNLYLLDNANKIIDDINFIGVTLPIEYYLEENSNNNLDIYLKKLKTYQSKYNILLCHTPINLTNKKLISKYNFDLILCGHTHGGIVPRIFRFLFKTNGLISPRKTLFPKNVYGNIKINKTNIVITSGIRVISNINIGLKLLQNVFAAEIVKIKIRKR